MNTLRSRQSRRRSHDIGQLQQIVVESVRVLPDLGVAPPHGSEPGNRPVQDPVGEEETTLLERMDRHVVPAAAPRIGLGSSESGGEASENVEAVAGQGMAPSRGAASQVIAGVEEENDFDFPGGPIGPLLWTGLR